MPSRTLHTGVTMIELMIVVSIAGLMAALAAPSFADFISSTRLASTMSQLSSDLNRARSEAIKRNSRVLFCKSNGTRTGCITNNAVYNAVPVVAANKGWLLCYDQNNDDACDASTADTPNPIAQHSEFAQMTLVSTTADPIRFNANGTQGTTPVTLTLT